MADLVAFSELPLQLVFKVRQLKIHLPNDTVNQVLTDVLNELALYLELYITEAQKAKTERKAVEEFRHAYQKTGSVRYYIEFVADDLLSDCEAIKETLEPIMEEYRGKYGFHSSWDDDNHNSFSSSWDDDDDW